MNLAAVTLRELLDPKRWSIACYAASAVACFAISATTLVFLGVNYVASGGAAWQKIHPATYLMALALAFNFVGQRRRWAWLRDLPSRAPGVSAFAPMWGLLIFYAVAVQHSPVAALIDTYFITMAALLLRDELPETVRWLLRTFVHVFLCVNAVIGIGEYIAHAHLFPLVASGNEVVEDHRSTALLGHSLQNAVTSGAYLLCLFLGADAAIGPMKRATLMMIQVLGLISFGGRTAIVTVSLIAALNMAKDFALVLLGARFDMRRAIGLAIGGPLLISFAAYAIYAGVFEDVFARFVDDNGSAEARVIMLRLFDAFELRDLLIGPDPQVVRTLLGSLGIRVGIESTWVSMIFEYGGLMTLCFTFAFGALLWDIWRRSQAGAAQIFIYFLVLISSGIGLAAKTMMLNHLTFMMLFVFSNQARTAAKISPMIGNADFAPAPSRDALVRAVPERGL